GSFACPPAQSLPLLTSPPANYIRSSHSSSIQHSSHLEPLPPRTVVFREPNERNQKWHRLQISKKLTTLLLAISWREPKCTMPAANTLARLNALSWRSGAVAYLMQCSVSAVSSASVTIIIRFLGPS